MLVQQVKSKECKQSKTKPVNDVSNLRNKMLIYLYQSAKTLFALFICKMRIFSKILMESTS